MNPLKRVAVAASIVCIAQSGMADPTLELEVVGGGGPVLSGELVFVNLAMSDLGGEEAAGFQAFIEYDPGVLSFVSAGYPAAPFGLPVITPIVPVGGEIDLAAGIDPDTQLPTPSDAIVATLTFLATDFQCEPQLAFRTHNPPTRITDGFGNAIEPLQLIGVSGLPETCPEDLSGDGVIDSIDLNILLAEFGTGSCGDIDGDNDTDSFDLNLLLAVFGDPC